MRDDIAKRIERFTERDPNSGCHLWSSANRKGYPIMMIDGRQVAIHRLVYADASGASINGLHILHTCDTPACINPLHLRAGSHTDNMRDAASKGRLGGRGGCRRVSEEMASQMVLALRSGTARGVARQFGVDTATVRRVRLRLGVALHHPDKEGGK